MTLELVIMRYGLVALFVGAAIEGETVAVIGGMLAHQHLIPLSGAMSVAAAGSFAADQLLFLAGRRFRDHPRVRRIASRPGFTKAMAAFERHPIGFAFLFRFVYGLRTVSPLAIGTSSLPTRTFVVINAVAALVWGIAFTGIGYLFGHGIERLFGKFHSVEHILIVVLATALMLFAISRIVRWLRRRPTDHIPAV